MDLSIETNLNDGTIFGIVPDEVNLRSIEIGAGAKADHPRKGWANKPMTVATLINSLTQHRVGQKDGPCLLQGSVVGGERRATAVRALDLLVLDMDTGESPEAVCSKIEDLGLFAIVHSSHSHLKSVSSIKKTALMKWCGKPDETPTLEDAVSYLIKEKRYQTGVLKDAVLLKEEQTTEGVQMLVQHQPMAKFRVVFVLEKPFVIAERHADQQKGILEWKERYAGASRMIGAYFDRACVDPSRLFYLPRHTKGAQFFTWVLAGKMLDVETLDRVTKEQLDHESKDVFEQEAESLGSDSNYKTSSLKKFASKYGDRFNIEEFIQDRGYEHRGHGSSGGSVFECPNDDYHSNAGDASDKGFWCKNSEGEQFAAKCQHSACVKLDRLDLIDRACQHGDTPIKDGKELLKWIDRLAEDADDFGWDDPTPEEKRLAEVTSRAVVPFASAKEATRELVGITKEIPQEEIFHFAKRIGASSFEEPEKLNLYSTLAVKTGFRANQLKAAAKESAEEAKAQRNLRNLQEKLTGSSGSANEFLSEWNKEFAVVSLGNSVRIMVKAKTPGRVPGFLSEHDFMLRTKNRLTAEIDPATQKTRIVPVAKQWLEWEGRESYNRVVFEPALSPEEASKDNVFNIWQGFPVEGKEGDWSLLHGHIRDNICQGDENAYVWLMTWIAQIYQQPGKKLGSAVAIRGKKGVGKSKLFDWIKDTMGPQAIKVSHRSHITGNFNSHQATCILMVCEEAFWAGDNASGGVLKDLITSPTSMMEKKGLDVIEVSNCLRLAMLSNEDWVVPAGLDDERRFFVLECSDAKKGDKKFFGAIDKQMENGGMEAMVHFFNNWVPEEHTITYKDTPELMTWDLLREPLHTKWLTEQALSSLDASERFFANLAQTGYATGVQDAPDIVLNTNEQTNISIALLMEHYNDFLRKASYSKQPIGNMVQLKKHADKWLLAEENLTVLPTEKGARPDQYLIVESWAAINERLAQRGIAPTPIQFMTHQELLEKIKASRLAPRDTPIDTEQLAPNVFLLESMKK